MKYRINRNKKTFVLVAENETDREILSFFAELYVEYGESYSLQSPVPQPSRHSRYGEILFRVKDERQNKSLLEQKAR